VTVQLPDDVVEDLRVRLRRTGGQVHAVETMLAEGRECRDIVTQLRAATKTLEQVGFRLISSGLTYCLENPNEAAESGYPIDEVQRLFTKLA
jgi:DNA-binding FrmR family transcriptional regulator